MAQETPGGPNQSQQIDLKLLKDTGQIQEISEADLSARWLSNINTLHIGGGHMAMLLAPSPIASALIHTDELFITSETLAAHESSIEALVSVSDLAARATRLDGSLRDEAIRTIIRLMQQEINQKSPQLVLEDAKDESLSPQQHVERILDARLVLHQYQAIATLDQLLRANPTANSYMSVDTGRLSTITRRLGSNWEKVRDDLNKEFPEVTS